LSEGIPLLGNGSESNATLTRRSANQDDKALTALFAGQMQFSLNFFKKVFNASNSGVQSNKGATENLFFSPMSIYSALLLAYFGANNRTENQLTDVLGFQNMDKVGHYGFYRLLIDSDIPEVTRHSLFSSLCQ
jgi:serine protease inhibitor